jgi:Flp pilus assembly protein TadD
VSFSPLRATATSFNVNRRLKFIFACLPAVLFCSCGRKEALPTPRYAVVGFENLSGDPSLDWVGRGASEFLSRSFRGDSVAGNGGKATFVSEETVERSLQARGAHPAGVPGESAARSAAISAGASRVISGYIERTAAGVRITASEEDVLTHKTLRTFSASSSTPFNALGAIARELFQKPGPPATNNAEAFRLYCTAIDGASSDAAPLLERAVALDPAFGRAWVALAQTYAVAGERDRAAGVIEKARAQRLASIDRARLDLADASLRGDREASLVSMRAMYELSRGDVELGHTLAGDETAAGNFSQSAAVWKKLTADSPTDVTAWNQLGYTLCWSGDYAGALAALGEYARLRPDDANPLDSQGDVHYWFGKYSDAAASYLAAYAKVPGFLNGGDLYKAAWAKFLAGDKTGADQQFERFRSIREKAKDPSIVLLAGDWLDRTGRTKEAFTLLRDASKNATGGLRAGIAAELAVWDLLEGERATAAKDVSDGGLEGITPGDLLVRFASMPDAPVSEWEARADHIFAPAQLAALRATALGYALILDGRKPAALPVWESVVKQTPGDFLPRAIVSKLKGQPVEHQTPPDPINLNPFVAVAGKL